MDTEDGGLNVINDKEIRFFTPRFYLFDSFSAYSIEIWGKVFPTAEHAYQWKKYSDIHPEIASQILGANNPSLVKKISDSHKKEVPLDWNERKVDVMTEILRAKVAQHEHAQKRLLESGERMIVENSPTDSFWGAGEDGNGQNMLGKIWMQLREELKKQ